MDAYAMLGRLYMAQNRTDSGADQRQAGTKATVGQATMAALMAQVRGNDAEARERYQKILKAHPRAPVAANNLAWIYADSGENLDDALRLARIARTGLPDVAEVSDTLGWVYYKRKQPADAVTAFSESVTKNPKNAIYQYHLGLAHLQAGDTGKARAALARALSLNPKFAGAEEAKRLLDGSGSERP
jgi:Tfp pilus assembly protein PilF